MTVGRMKFRIHLLFGVAPVCLMLCPSPLRAGQKTVAVPVTHAQAVIVIDAASGRVLFGKNPDLRLPPASTTKIMTGWLLARKLPPNSLVTANPEAASTPGNALKMRSGEKFISQDLLHAILLISANDASEAAAHSLDGTTAHFVEEMNTEAHRLGARDTHFANPHGLSAAGHFSTARDLATLARAALGDPAFSAAVKTKRYLLRRDHGRSPTPLVNANRLLWTVPGMDGVKNGYTDAAGSCFVGSATRKGIRVITVVLHSDNWQADTRALIEYGFSKLAGRASRTGSRYPTGQGVGAKPTTPAVPRVILQSNVATQQETVSKSNVIAQPPPDSPGLTHSKVNERTKGTEAGISLPDDRGGQRDPSLWTGLKRRAAALFRGSPSAQGAATREASGANTWLSSSAQADIPAGPGVSRNVSLGLPSGSATAGDGSNVAPNEPVRHSSFTPGASAVRNVPRAPSGLNVSAPPPARRASSLPGTPFREGRPRAATPLAEMGKGQERLKRDESGGGLLSSSLSPFWMGWLALILAMIAMLCIAWRKRSILKLPEWMLPLRKRKRSQFVSDEYVSDGFGDSTAPLRRTEAALESPSFTYVPADLERREGATWMDGVLETPNRLFEPSVRRQMRALIDADPTGRAPKLLSLLAANNPKMRLVAADVLSSATPRRSEEALLALLEEEKTPPEIRSEAIQLLAAQGGDRHERLWLQTVLRDGSAAAANALAKLARLDETTEAAFKHSLQASRAEARVNDTNLKLAIRDAQIACVLCAHERFSPSEAKALLRALPTNHRENTIIGCLRGAPSPWATEQLVETVLTGHAYPALHALLESDLDQVETYLEQRWFGLDAGARTRTMILKWLLLGHGDTQAIQKLADAGNELASGALQLGKTQMWDPRNGSPDALMAAAQILSLRLGYSSHGQDQIAQAFRKAATGETDGEQLEQSPELQPLMHAYTHPEVYEAVQATMHSGEGLNLLLSCMARNPQTKYLPEIAFWSDKVERDTRSVLANALAASEDPVILSALGARANDRSPEVRAMALRALRHQSVTRSREEVEPSSVPEEEPVENGPDQAHRESQEGLPLDNAA